MTYLEKMKTGWLVAIRTPKGPHTFARFNELPEPVQAGIPAQYPDMVFPPRMSLFEYQGKHYGLCLGDIPIHLIDPLEHKEFYPDGFAKN